MVSRRLGAGFCYDIPVAEEKYNHKLIEPKWQKYWADNQIFKAIDGDKKAKYYALDMFAYPSGDGLHTGHPRSYTATDIFARYFRMKGYNVMRPIGWDAFGLPAENYAIKKGVRPSKTTAENIVNFTRQVKSFGFAYDWDREVNTADPYYYKWTQWVFKVLYDNGLAYQKEAYANWCPKDQTVLANEQAVNGCCDRCGTQVEQKKLKQWFFKITDFAEELLAGLDKIDWPESTKTGQRNWIGRSEGARIQFKISKSANQQIEVFTTRPDTLFGATYLVLAPEHELIQHLASSIQNLAEVEGYIEQARRKSTLIRQTQKDKSGVCIKGLTAINPATKKEIPIWIADYVLTDYGTGAIMAVPAHDERDFDFAKEFKLPVVQVIKQVSGLAGKQVSDSRDDEQPYTGHGELMNSGEFDGQDSKMAGPKMAKKFGGEIAVQYKLHDWLISRQRYWGAPIPIVYKTIGIMSNVQSPMFNEEVMSVDERDLPVLLPDDVDFKPTGESPLAKSKTFQAGVEEKYGKGAHRELDTMDTFVCSSWYFLRYCDPHNKKEFAGKKSLKYWMPVDLYIGGAEHTNGHLLYARFITKVLHKLGYLDFDEPFLKLRHQGLVLGSDGEKMSKSRENVINPDDLIEKYGADTVRMYEMFMGPFDQSIAWDTNGVVGVRKFLDRVYRIVSERAGGKGKQNDSIHGLIKKVTEDIGTMKFNTAVSSFMEFTNEVARDDSNNWLMDFVKLLNPFAPHLAEELWQVVLKQKGSVANAKWPEFDVAKTQAKIVTIAVQEKGKLRGTVEVPAGTDEKGVKMEVNKNEKLAAIAVASSNHIFVKDRIINFI